MKKNVIRLLIVEDEAFDVERIIQTLNPYKKQIAIKSIVSTGQDALTLIEKDPDAFDVVILDYQISGGLLGVELIEAIKKISPSLQVIVITKMTLNQIDVDFAIKLIESGASWFGTKNPVDMEDFIYQPTDFMLAIQNAYEKRILHREKKHLLNERKKTFDKLDSNIKNILDRHRIIGDSPEITQVKFLISRFAEIDTAVLISGESGTGKELVATHLHYYSKRRFENLITVNCSAIPESLFESELFGHEKGAFTDAKSEKKGFFEQADKGTLFLDEVGEISFPMQAKLLRALETGEIDKIGRKERMKVDVRVIAATNKNLPELVKKGEFRGDLFYRLNILNIHIPSLRERRDDINVLFDYFIKMYCTEHDIIQPEIDKETGHFIENFSWPGNVRQIKNVALRMLLLQNGIINMNVIRMALGDQIESKFDDFLTVMPDKETIIPLREAERKFRKRYIENALSHFNSDAETARHLNIEKSNFHRMLKELNLK